VPDIYTCTQTNSHNGTITDQFGEEYTLESSDFTVLVASTKGYRRVTAKTRSRGVSFDTILVINENCTEHVTPETVVSADNDGGSGSFSKVAWLAKPNTVYFVTVEGFQGACGTVDLVFDVINVREGSCIDPHVVDLSRTQEFQSEISMCGANSFDTRITGALSNVLEGDDYIFFLGGAPQKRAITFDVQNYYDENEYSYRESLVFVSRTCNSDQKESDIIPPIEFSYTSGTRFTFIVEKEVDYFIAIEGNDRGCGKTDVSITSVVASVGTCFTPKVLDIPLGKMVVESGVDTCVSDTFGYSRTDDFFGNEYVFNLTQFSEDRVIAVETKGGASGGFDSWIFISKTCKEDQSLDDVVTYNDDKSYTNTLESRFSYAQFRAKANTDYFIVIGGYNGSCGEIDAEFSASLLSFACLSVEGAVLTTSLTMDLDFDDLDAMFEVGLAATFRQNMLKEFPSFFTNKIAECYNMVQVRSLERGSVVAQIDTRTTSPENAQQLRVELLSYTAKDYEEKLLSGLNIKISEASSYIGAGPVLANENKDKSSSNPDTAVIGGAVGGAVGGTIFIASVFAVAIYMHKAAKQQTKPGAVAPEPPSRQSMNEDSSVPEIKATPPSSTGPKIKQPVPHLDMEEGSGGTSSAPYTPL